MSILQKLVFQFYVLFIKIFNFPNLQVTFD